MFKHFLLFLALVAVSTASKSYKNYKVYLVVPTSDVQVQRINDLRKESFDFWTDVVVVNQDVRIMVSPEREQEFVNYISAIGLNASIAVPNVQELIEAQLKPAKIDRSTSLGSFDWLEYHQLPEIHAWLDELEVMFPNVVTTVTIGHSYEGRAIKGVKIDLKGDAREGTPLVAMIEGGIHAREWISPATITWIIKEFLTSEDPAVKLLAENFVWHIFPVANPDGYVYTFDGDRMWRKNRNPENYVVCNNNVDLGNGIDLNRNFDYRWMTVGASENPCTQTYAGPAPASENEAQAISNYALSLKSTGNFLYYLAFHSYSQMILIPHSHLSGQDVLQVSNYGDLYEIAARGAAALKSVHGIDYQVGTSADILYEVSGSSFDWAKGIAEIPISFLFELRDLGATGFLLPPEQIIPNNEEVIACLVEMDQAIRDLNYYDSSDSGSSAVIGSVMIMIMSICLLFVLQ